MTMTSTDSPAFYVRPAQPEEAGAFFAQTPEQDALHLAQNLDCYERISGSLYDYGIKSFQERFALNDECIFELEEYTDFARYGQACAESNGFVQTEFGQVRRIAQQLEQVHSDEMTL